MGAEKRLNGREKIRPFKHFPAPNYCPWVSEDASLGNKVGRLDRNSSNKSFDTTAPLEPLERLRILSTTTKDNKEMAINTGHGISLYLSLIADIHVRSCKLKPFMFGNKYRALKHWSY